MSDDALPCCLASLLAPGQSVDHGDEPEGERVPDGAPVIDAHVHLFPAGVAQAIWRWFDENAWRIRYRLHAEQIVEFLTRRGVKRFCALVYSHKPGLSTVLNRFVAETARAHPEVIPLGTVLPGEPGAADVLREAFGPLGLRGIKLHCHVQKMPADDPRLDEVYALCQAAGRPVVIHAGRLPALSGYGLDPNKLCAASQVDRVLARYPKLTMVVPHFGADEYDDYLALLDRHENLYLDTTMMIGGYFQSRPPPALFPGRASRLLYGTDFPNLPYAWDRELKAALAAGMSPEEQTALFSGNALRLFG